MTGSSRTADDLRATLEGFVAAAKTPALIEPGEDPLPLVPGSYAIDVTAGRVAIQAWDDTRNLSRRVVEAKQTAPGQIELTVERFRRTGSILLVDAARIAGQRAAKRGERLRYREHFRRSLSRQFPGWNVAAISSEPDLHHSLSPSFPRALLTRGQAGVAVIGAPADSADPAAALTYGLIWLDYLRRRERDVRISTLAVLVPLGAERTTCLRVRWLDPGKASYRVFAYDERYESEVDIGDYGNVDTEVAPHAHMPSGALDALSDMQSVPGVHAVTSVDGSVSLRVHGLEFANLKNGELQVGIDTRQRGTAAEAGSMARELARLRKPGGRSELASRHPELWLEAQVRRSLDRIDASLVPAPVYGQVPAMAASDRGIIDLLAADRSGRLAVIELKVTEDPHLPLQALDYWLRVRWHLERGEFTSNGYFPGTALRTDPPRMLLIAPAMYWHPTTATILSFFSPEIDVERIGLAAGWRETPDVMFRLRGAEQPVMPSSGF